MTEGSEETPPAMDDDGGGWPLEAPEQLACPSCGAVLRGADALLCVRCGYDLRTMSPTATDAREENIDAPDSSMPPLVRRTPGGVWIPASLAVIAFVLVLWGVLSGYRGLFPVGPAVTEIPWPDRWAGAARLPAMIVLWSACGLAALGIAAWIADRPFGDVRRAVYRMLAIVSGASLFRFVSLDTPALEVPVQLVGQSLAFVVACLVLFRLKLRDALVVLLLTVGGFIVVTVVAHFVAWAT